MPCRNQWVYNEQRGQVRRIKVGTAASWSVASVGPLGRITSSAQHTKTADGVERTYTFRYGQYNDGSLASITYPSMKTVSYCYDLLGRPSWLSAARTATDCKNGTGNGALYAAVGSYFPHGAIRNMTYGNTLVESSDYNNRLQPLSLSLGTSGSLSALWNLQYEYSRTGTANNGNILKQTVTAPNMTPIVSAYSYDQANRLLMAAEQPVNAAAPVCNVSTDVATNGWCQRYGYDRYGNRTIAARVNDGPAITEPASFSATNNRIADAGWEYAASGARGEVALDPFGLRYAYDGESRMAMVCPNESTCTTTWQGGRTQYVYDADGRRVRQRNASGAETLYVYDAAGRLAAEYATAPDFEGGGTRYLTADHLGSTRVVTAAMGSLNAGDADYIVKARYDYQPFGAEIAVSASSPRYGIAGYGLASDAGLRYKFTGKERDAETGLDFFGARYFSSAQGRFTSPDAPFNDQNPSEPQSWNLYTYTRNNPLIFVDPSGRECVKLDSGGVGDDGQGNACQDKSLQTTHGVTVNGTTGDATYSAFGNAVQMGDINLSGSRDRIQGAPDELLNALPIAKAALVMGKVGLTLGPLASAVGKRDYAILLLLVTYGLRAREVGTLTLDDIDWKRDRLDIRGRKAGHSTAYPLAPQVGEAVLDYLKQGRSKTTERFSFELTLPIRHSRA